VRGGRARFINHSCDPNCYTKIFTIDGTRKIGIYAKKAIALGQELAYDYKVGVVPKVYIMRPGCWW
jgi:SET domain-containing protein